MLTIIMGLKEIAKLANISPATVSLVLNNKPGVGNATRTKILKIAEELNYRVPEKRFRPEANNGTIQFLKLSNHGEILNKDLNIFINDYIDGIDNVVKQMQYKFEISSHKLEEMDLIVKDSKKRNLQGMIILGTELSSEEVKSLDSIPIPIVIIDTNYEFLSADFVNMNNIGALHKIIGHLVETGHRKIGMVSCSIPSGNFTLREKGFIEAVTMKNLEADPSLMLKVRPGFEDSCEDMLQILKDGWKLPEAIFCSNDIIAYGCIKALKMQGIRVPQDVSVIGFDDLPISAMMEPQLTTIRVSQKQIGSLAMQLLIQKMNIKAENHPVSAQVSGTLIKRESVLDRKI